MDSINKFKLIAQHNHGIIQTSEAIHQGISRALLSKYVQKGKLLRIAQGQYILPEDIEDELLSLSYRSRYIIFSHESALFLHGLSDRTPFEHTVTVPSTVTVSRDLNNRCKIYYVKKELHELGKELRQTKMGNLVPVYNMERTLCDVVRSRNRLGEETFLAALKAYAKHSEKNIPRLGNYAEQFRLTRLVRQYLEVLL